jgi:hypothetical protein
MESDWIPMDRGSHDEADGNAISKTRKHQKLPVGYFNTCNKTPTPGEHDVR